MGNVPWDINFHPSNKLSITTTTKCSRREINMRTKKRVTKLDEKKVIALG